MHSIRELPYFCTATVLRSMGYPGQRCARGRIPEPDCLVTGCERVRQECHGRDPTRMALEHLLRCARGQVPEPDRLATALT